MPVEKDINLDNVESWSEEDFQKWEEESQYLQDLAQSAEVSAEKIEKAKKSLEGLNFAQLDILNKSIESGSTSNLTVKGQPITTESLVQLVVEVLEKIEKQKEETREIKKKVDQAEKERIAQMREFREIQSKLEQGANELTGFISSPTGFAKNKFMKYLGRAGLYGAIASFMISFAQEIFDTVVDQIKDLYKDGGLLDPRKKVLDEMKTIAPLRTVIDINQGKIFFTSDTSEMLRQGVATSTNTRSMVNGHKQYIQEFG